MNPRISPICRRAVRSLRVIARLNLRQARAARAHGLALLAGHHIAVALEVRADANALLRTAR